MPEARGCQKLARPRGACCYPDRADDVSAGGINHPGFGRRRDPQWSAPRAEWRTGSTPFRIRPRHTASPHPLPSRQFHALFDSLFKVLFILPSRYFIGLSPVFSLRRNLPPYLGCIPKQPDSPSAPRGATGSGHDGALTLSGAPFQGTWARSVTEDASTDYNSSSGAARFSSWALPVSLAVTRGILTATGPLRTVAMVGFIRARCDARPGKASDASGHRMPCRDPQRTLGFSRPPTGERRANIRIRDEPRHWGGDGAAERRKARRPGRRALDPMGLGRNLRSKTRWFTGFCNSHQVSHFATFFIDARA
ncbi:hypothetical protein QJS10_CPA08g00778 [Acorus calamus]|uniref:Uncharacterized protein n=1 Tax=Acorus calamus TaxID=4465 RepID=A0AAV9EC93_ACOCL|nr:hypothetical protein QJS10_CPA08g00778 [Acorus calamus]